MISPSNFQPCLIEMSPVMGIVKTQFPGFFNWRLRFKTLVGRLGGWGGGLETVTLTSAFCVS